MVTKLHKDLKQKFKFGISEFVYTLGLKSSIEHITIIPQFADNFAIFKDIEHEEEIDSIRFSFIGRGLQEQCRDINTLKKYFTMIGENHTGIQCPDFQDTVNKIDIPYALYLEGQRSLYKNKELDIFKSSMIEDEGGEDDEEKNDNITLPDMFVSSRTEDRETPLSSAPKVEKRTSPTNSQLFKEQREAREEERRIKMESEFKEFDEESGEESDDEDGMELYDPKTKLRT